MKVSLWDTAGQDRYKALNRSYYKDVKGAFLVADLTSAPGMNRFDYWLQELKDNATEGVQVVVLGNKADLDNRDNENAEGLKDYAQKHGYKYFETSAKTGKNIDLAMQSLLKQVKDQFYKDYKPTNTSYQERHSLTLKKEEENVSSISKQKCNC
jgi:small GTP-binding protein